jgi:hypothetical protein
MGIARTLSSGVLSAARVSPRAKTVTTKTTFKSEKNRTIFSLSVCLPFCVAVDGIRGEKLRMNF